MHRISSARNLYQSSLPAIPLPSSNYYIKSASAVKIKCSFCQRILANRIDAEYFYTTRHQSTRAVNLLTSSQKKKKHRSYKKYGELLEVGDQAMTETKVSIRNLRPVHLSKLASSPVSLGQLHKLTTQPSKYQKVPEVDPELLQTIRDKLLKKKTSVHNYSTSATGSFKLSDTVLEDDKCALIYTSYPLINIEDKFNTKQYIDMVKESYYNFRKATIYDQRLQDLGYAINEGLRQELNLNEMTSYKSDQSKEEKYFQPLPKGPHAVFRELFIENQLDSYDQELMSHITNMQAQDLTHTTIEEDIYDDPNRDDLDVYSTELAPVETLKIKQEKEKMRKKTKARREKLRAKKEMNMKKDIKEIVMKGKQEALHHALTAHLQLLCSLNMIKEAHQVLQHYRRSNSANRPKINDVTVYNTLLRGYAKKGLLDKSLKLISYMNTDKIAMNAQTYAGLFECIQRSNVSKKINLLTHYEREMSDKNITLNDLLDKSKFLYDQREVVLQAIRRIRPDFVPQYTPPVLDYDCPLMHRLTLDNVESRRGLLTSMAEHVLPLEEVIKKGKEQIEAEIKGEVEIENIGVKDKKSPFVEFCRKKMCEAETEWREVIRKAFERNLATLKPQSAVSRSAITLYPYLKVLTVEQFVDLIMAQIRKLVDGSETYSPTLKLLQRDLGSEVYEKYQIEQYRQNGIMEKTKHIYGKYCDWYVNRESVDGTGLPYNGRQVWQALVHSHREGPSLDIEETAWPMETRQNIGKFLYNIIINDVKIDVNMFKEKAKEKKLPAVYKVHRSWGRLLRLELKTHPVLARAWAGAAPDTLRMRTVLVPTRAPPAPWAGPAHGAFLFTHSPLIRMQPNVKCQWRRIKSAPPESLYPILDSLNQLGEVPWVINKPILDLQIKIFREGGNKKLDIPPPSSSLDMSQLESAGMSTGDKFKRRLALYRARAEMHSLWCDALYKLSLSNHFRDSIFWLPHNMDFRGRVYSVGPHVCALGADPQRALLRFAQGRALGPRGLDWLKLHAINLTGTMKKNSLRERLEHVESIMDKILDSADRPLNGEGWWMESEEPWQTLACCMEIANAVRSPNPEEYVCGFPVHQDGSCNGLQHYAALGGDADGARAVNLAPLDRPADVYSSVVALVEEKRALDAAAGVPAAIILKNFITRKVIKQTVMTTVYGVTRFGARLQIAKQLKDIEEFPKEHVWTCSMYLTAKTFDSLSEMFSSAKLIQDWFTDCAKVISGVCGESVEWVTPLGLPVVQPYYKRTGSGADNVLHRVSLDQHQRPCSVKQRNAFPPNLIHSLDSSHMMLTGLHCAAQGVTFVSVHDCFWTHPHCVDLMNQICREQFVALHSQPILENLSKFMVKRYSYDDSELENDKGGTEEKRHVNNLLRRVPKKGNFDITSVLKSVYFFS